MFSSFGGRERTPRTPKKRKRWMWIDVSSTTNGGESKTKKKTRKEIEGSKKEEGEGSLGSKKQQKPDNQWLALMILGDKSSRKRINFFLSYKPTSTKQRESLFCLVLKEPKGPTSAPPFLQPLLHAHTHCAHGSRFHLFFLPVRPKKNCFGFFFLFVAF